MDSRSSDLHRFLEVRTISKNCVCRLSGISLKREIRDGRRSDKDEDGKNYPFIYTTISRKSYRDNSRSVLKSKIPRFQRSFTRPSKMVIFECYNGFRNFNKIRSGGSKVNI